MSGKMDRKIAYIIKEWPLTLTVEDDFFGVNFGCISLFWFHFSKNRGTTFPLWTNGGKSWRSAKPKDLLNPVQANPVNQPKTNVDGKLALRMGDSLLGSVDWTSPTGPKTGSM